jgi:D-alanyl-D-alanine carboxypeptidase
MKESPRRRRTRHRVVTPVLIGLAIAGSAVPATAAAARPRAGDAEPRSSIVNGLRGDIQTFLQQRAGPDHLSAVSLRVTRPGTRPIDLQAGTTRWHGGQPVTSRTLWQIGSNTKAFTSVALLKLEAKGRLSINDRIGTWLPQYPAWRNITIKQLLSMTSAIPDYAGRPAFLHALDVDPDHTFTAAQELSYVKDLPLRHAGYGYSNTNFVLAELIIARASRESYFRDVQTQVIDPLRLHNTCFAPETCPASVAREMPDGYSEQSVLPAHRGVAVPKLNVTSAQGAGGLVSSLPDLLSWERALYDGRILPAAQQRQLTSLVSKRTGRSIRSVTPSDPMGFGLGVKQAIYPVIGRAWYYDGATWGYIVLHVFVPRTGIAFAVAVNSDYDDASDLQGLAEAIYASASPVK